MFKQRSSQTVYQNTWMTVFEDAIEFPDGSSGIYGYVRRSDGAGIAAINPAQEILLIKQYRYPIKAYEWNIPGGGIDGDQPAAAAQRELMEETGVTIESIEKIGEFYPLSSCSTEKGYIFLCRVSNSSLPAEDVSDHNEDVQEKRFVPLAEALAMIDRGEITDAATSNVIQLVARRLAR